MKKYIINLFFCFSLFSQEIPFRVFPNLKGKFSGYLESRLSGEKPLLTNSGVSTSYKNFILLGMVGRRITDEVTPDLYNRLYGGYQNSLFSFLSRFDGLNSNNYSLFFSLNIHSQKCIYFVHENKNNLKGTFFGIQSGNLLRVTVELGFYGNEPEGRLSLSFQFGELGIGADLQSRSSDISNTGIILSYSEESRKEIGLWKEEDTKETISFRNLPQPILNTKNTKIDNPFSRRKITFPLTIGELLLKKIPLSQALQIERASKSREKYEKLISTLSVSTKKSLTSLQIEKLKNWRD